MGPNLHVSSMASGIHQMNARSWDNLILSMIKSGLLRTTRKISQIEINLTVRKRIVLFLTVQLMKYYCRKTKKSVMRRDHTKN